MPRRPGKLTPKQAAFAREYLVDLNATQAAARAGYSPETAHSIGCENLTKPNIARAIQELMAHRAEKLEISAERVVQELAKIAFANLGDYFIVEADGLPRLDLSRVSRDQTAGIVALEVREQVFTLAEGGTRTVRTARIRLADKRAALVDLGRHLRIFHDEAPQQQVNFNIIYHPKATRNPNDPYGPRKVGRLTQGGGPTMLEHAHDEPHRERDSG